MGLYVKIDHIIIEFYIYMNVCITAVTHRKTGGCSRPTQSRRKIFAQYNCSQLLSVVHSFSLLSLYVYTVRLERNLNESIKEESFYSRVSWTKLESTHILEHLYLCTRPLILELHCSWKSGP